MSVLSRGATGPHVPSTLVEYQPQALEWEQYINIKKPDRADRGPPDPMHEGGDVQDSATDQSPVATLRRAWTLRKLQFNSRMNGRSP